jgi:predicted TIM-barrel fold metal-dependent hydrolase
MRVIDLENHFASTAWLDALRRNEGYPKITPGPEGRELLHWAPNNWVPFIGQRIEDVGDGRIRYMDEAGIDVAVLSLAASGAEPFEPAIGTKIARGTNDQLAEVIQKHPSRFLGFATLAPKAVDEAVKELERCVRELGFKGWNTHSNFGDSYLDEKRYWPLLAKAQELDIPIYLHPTLPIIREFLGYGSGLSASSFGFGAEVSMVVMRLIVGGVFDVFPDLKIILGHYAEGLPFMLDRVDRGYLGGHIRPIPGIAPELKQLPSYYLKRNIFATTSGNYQRSSFSMTRDELGGDHVMLGTDYPYEDMSACMSFLRGLGLSDADEETLFEKAAVSLGFAK